MSYTILSKKTETKAEFYITKKKIVLALIILLTAVAIMKTNSVGNANKKLLDSNSAILALKFIEMKDSNEYKEILSKPPFCGWKITSDKETFSSENFEKTSLLGELISKEIENDNKKETTTICISNEVKQKIDRSTRNNIVFIFILGASLFMLVFFDDKKPEEEAEEDENKEIPTT